MIDKSRSLADELLAIIDHKGTEAPFVGNYYEFDQAGTYLCRRCGLALFRAHHKFHSGCGWPSYDDNIGGTIITETDADGQRTEELCVRCRAHLGHIFSGEQYTDKNIRHCINSVCLDFVEDESALDSEEAIFAAGCFWGVEYYFKQLPGVLRTEVGYSGGTTDHPTYQQVCHENTGHLEVIRVLYDPDKINYEAICKHFFEIHNPLQRDGQGPDIGEQYLSRIFYYNDSQKSVAQKLIHQLEKKGLEIATQISPVTKFWPAEIDHQDYYKKTGKQPYCHRYEKRFD